MSTSDDLASGPVEPAPNLPPRFRILVVDDDPQVCTLMQIFLRRVGVLVETAPDGEAGWECLQNQTYDLVVLDLVMPRLSGLDLARRIRSHSLTVPLVVVSGDLHQFDRSHLQSLQILEAFEKGFNFQELSRRLEALLLAQPRPPSA
ncbi:MAG: response regulator [Verrucomicrobia bacterium]|nr:response regulator [Verrucomicrobiota bacterium]